MSFLAQALDSAKNALARGLGPDEVVRTVDALGDCHFLIVRNWQRD